VLRRHDPTRRGLFVTAIEAKSLDSIESVTADVWSWAGENLLRRSGGCTTRCGELVSGATPRSRQS
jgi:hypothetical protein